LGEPLNANFQGQDYAGRLEGGYRFAVPIAYETIGITPYAATQAQDFHTPAYSETGVTERANLKRDDEAPATTPISSEDRFSRIRRG
jgi:uncharacterized protein with beta-barrel porin domain